MLDRIPIDDVDTAEDHADVTGQRGEHQSSTCSLSVDRNIWHDESDQNAYM